eukprot:c16690_g1_i1.p1 GENE.c16690_g1_i1~~c16690_g1_i1.p1  ORF type:complete len:240 (+),score=40.81 c16690_g1_i1:546-1265(+)
MLARCVLRSAALGLRLPAASRVLPANRTYWSVRKEIYRLEKEREEDRKANPILPPPVPWETLCDMGQVEVAFTLLSRGVERWEDDNELAQKYIHILASSFENFGHVRAQWMLERILAHLKFPTDNANVWGNIAYYLSANGHIELGLRVLIRMTENGHLPDREALPALISFARHRAHDDLANQLVVWYKACYNGQDPTIPKLGPEGLRIEGIEWEKLEVPNVQALLKQLATPKTTPQPSA